MKELLWLTDSTSFSSSSNLSSDGIFSLLTLLKTIPSSFYRYELLSLLLSNMILSSSSSSSSLFSKSLLELLKQLKSKLFIKSILDEIVKICCQCFHELIKPEQQLSKEEKEEEKMKPRTLDFKNDEETLEINQTPQNENEEEKEKKRQEKQHQFHNSTLLLFQFLLFLFDDLIRIEKEKLFFLILNIFNNMIFSLFDLSMNHTSSLSLFLIKMEFQSYFEHFLSLFSNHVDERKEVFLSFLQIISLSFSSSSASSSASSSSSSSSSSSNGTKEKMIGSSASASFPPFLDFYLSCFLDSFSSQQMKQVLSSLLNDGNDSSERIRYQWLKNQYYERNQKKSKEKRERIQTVFFSYERGKASNDVSKRFLLELINEQTKKHSMEEMGQSSTSEEDVEGNEWNRFIHSLLQFDYQRYEKVMTATLTNKGKDKSYSFPSPSSSLFSHSSSSAATAYDYHFDHFLLLYRSR
jgi:hypothetical protein